MERDYVLEIDGLLLPSDDVLVLPSLVSGRSGRWVHCRHRVEGLADLAEGLQGQGHLLEHR